MKFDARCQLKSINFYLGLRKKKQSQVSIQYKLLQSYYVVVSKTSWWRDDRKPEPLLSPTSQQ